MVEHNPFDDYRASIKRDMRAYTFMGMVLLVGFIVVVLMGGLMLKQNRKMIHDRGCYVWADGHTTCRVLPQ